MNPSTPWHKTLFGRTALLLGITLFLFQIFIFSISAYYVGLPLAKRAANDFASLIIDVVNDKNQLSTARQTEFAKNLQKTHELSFYNPTIGELHPYTAELPYLQFLIEALEKQTKQPVALFSNNNSNHNGSTWFWLKLNNATEQEFIGFAETRIGAQPFHIILPVIFIILLLSFISSVLLARYLTRPISRLADATHSMGKGELPEPLPESGPEELALLSRSFNEMAKQVNHLLANRTTLLAGVSHDLRTPLTRMALALELLENAYDPELVQHLRTDISDMEKLISQFLGFARGIQPGSMLIEADINQLIKEWVSDAQRGGAVVIYQQKKQPVIMRMDTTALHRVFINLLENAIRYSHGEPVEVQLNAIEHNCTITILDSGPGIPPDKLENVFQPFYRLESSRCDATGGSGLGLSIAREICTANKWQLLLSPRTESGTCASINLSR